MSKIAKMIVLLCLVSLAAACGKDFSAGLILNESEENPPVPEENPPDDPDNPDNPNPVNPGEEELCGDGLDSDGDGEVDEKCGCTVGSAQPCYAGPEFTRNIGNCKDGVQQCMGEMEFMVWGPCEDQTLPGEEICDGLDNDCDGDVDEVCPPSECYPHEFDTETICDNGIDDECDGLTDCADPDCVCGCVPVPENCTNGIDDDCDGLVDCWDFTDCIYMYGQPENCENGVDDNCDFMVDCDDTATCCYSPTCATTGGCGNICCVPGTERYCDAPYSCNWGKQQCTPDGLWGECSETPDKPGGCTSTYYDPACCVSAGACCQNFPTDDTSIGSCDGINADCTYV
jgi:hypothetical protein